MKKAFFTALLCSALAAGTQAADITLNADQFQPVVGLYMGVNQGILLTGTTAGACGNQLMLHPLANGGTGTQEPSPLGLHTMTA